MNNALRILCRILTGMYALLFVLYVMDAIALTRITVGFALINSAMLFAMLADSAKK